MGDRIEMLHIGDELQLGRVDQLEHGIVGLDSSDEGISRRSVQLLVTEVGVLVRNLSSKTTIHVDPPTTGPPLSLGPRQQTLLVPPSGFEIRGQIRTHRIQIDGEAATSSISTIPDGVLSGEQTFVPNVAFSEADKDAFAALFSGYLEAFPRRDCEPLTYAQAGALLGLPASTVRRRIEHARERLAEAGLWIEGRNARRELAVYVLNMGIIVPDDLRRLRS